MRSIRRRLRPPASTPRAAAPTPAAPGAQNSAPLWQLARIELSRRRFLQAALAILAAVAAPFGRLTRARAAVPGGFFTHRELGTLAALCDQVIPRDHDP